MSQQIGGGKANVPEIKITLKRNNELPLLWDSNLGISTNGDPAVPEDQEE